MGTVVAIETDGGAAIAGDKRVIHGGTVTGESATRVVDLEGAGAGAVGEEGAVDAFQRRLEVELQDARRDREVTADVLGRIAAPIAEETGVEAVVAAHDNEGVARIRQVGSDGSVLSDPVAALGSGTQAALGQLEGVDRGEDPDSSEELLREVLKNVAKRDSTTGDEVDCWSLANESANG